jgi:hypothetical protein
MIGISALGCIERPLARPLLNRGLLPLPHFRRNHPHLEQQSLRFDAAPDHVEVLLRQGRRAGRDVDEHAFQLVEYRCDGRIAGGRSGLPIQPVGREQLLRARLLRRDVDATGALRAHQLHQHHLRSIEVIAEVDEQNPFAHVFGGSLRRRGRAC